MFETRGKRETMTTRPKEDEQDQEDEEEEELERNTYLKLYRRVCVDRLWLE